jgi:DNA-binding winged helix-turn-helix (wHTH) protein/TolB-like protein
VYEFGAFRYDATQRLLFRKGELVSLAPKAIDTLHVLLERRGRVVDKDELMKLVWPDTVVEEIGLARNISLLRKTLGGEADTYIETIPKRGYRFLADSPAAAVPRRRWPWLAGAAALLALGALIYWQFYAASDYLPQGKDFTSLAVVPFENLATPEQISQGLNEVLVAELAKLKGIHVISPSTVRRYLWLGISPGVMARVLGVPVTLEGAVQKTGDRLRITAWLADVHSGKLIWAETYDQTAGDQALARTIAAEVGRRLAGGRAKE